MKLEVMAIFDVACRAFLPPFVVASEAIALRQFLQLAETQPKHDFVRFSHQYTLYRLGEWDNETGRFSNLEPEGLGTLQVLMGQRDLLDSASSAEGASGE